MDTQNSWDFVPGENFLQVFDATTDQYDQFRLDRRMNFLALKKCPFLPLDDYKRLIINRVDATIGIHMQNFRLVKSKIWD